MIPYLAVRFKSTNELGTRQELGLMMMLGPMVVCDGATFDEKN